MYEFYKGHFTPGISEKIKEYATETVFKLSRYIFTTRKGRQQFGYCTYCHGEYKTEGLKHNQVTECPVCGSECTIKSSGRGRKSMVDDAYFMYYEKSAINPKAIVARGILAARDYSGDYKNVKTQYLETARYVFEMGGSVMFIRYGFFSGAGTMETWDSWRKRTGVYSMFGQQFVRNKRFHGISYESIQTAIKGTPFEYSTIEEYPDQSAEVFLSLYSKYPCIEYLTKFGFKNIVVAKLEGYATYGAINWRGNTLYKVLKLTKKDLKELAKANMEISTLTLCLYQISKKDGSNLTFSEFEDIAAQNYFTKDLKKILKHTSLRQADKYINKQFALGKEQEERAQNKGNYLRIYWRKYDVVRTWLDYYADCQRLNMDITQKSVLYPRNLYQAHQNTIKQVKIKANKGLDEKIQAKVKRLTTLYCFEHKGLVIRPAGGSGELIKEGKALNHCVGTYADSYARGDSILLVIRQKTELDKPYFTVELRKNTVVQCRGKNNCAPDKNVEKFIEAFEAAKLRDKKPKVKITVPA